MNINLGDTRWLIDEAGKAGLLRNQLAYVLATAYHETAHTMKPIKEQGSDKYLKSKKYHPYVGRGYAQVTWKENYEKVAKLLNIDCVNKPDLLLKPEYAIPAIITGMKDGWFTGKSYQIILHCSVQTSKTPVALSTIWIKQISLSNMPSSMTKHY